MILLLNEEEPDPFAPELEELPVVRLNDSPWVDETPLVDELPLLELILRAVRTTSRVAYLL